MSKLPPPLVSVVIGVYQRDRFLRQAIRSALGQTFDDIEVIVAEDGGSDCASAIVNSIADPRLKLARCATRLGESGNRVNAYRQASGRYFVNLDDDDLLGPQLVQRLVEPLERCPQAIVSFSDHFLIDVEGTINWKCTDACTKAFRRDRLAGGLHDPLSEFGLTCPTMPMNVAAMFRRELVLPHGSDGAAAVPVEAGAADDLYLTYLACMSGCLVHYVPERLSYYRVHENQLTMSGAPETWESVGFCYREFMRDERLAAHRRRLQKELSRSIARRGFDLLRRDARDARDTARRCFAESIVRSPSGRASAGMVLTALPAGLVKRIFRVHHRLRHPLNHALVSE